MMRATLLALTLAACAPVARPNRFIVPAAQGKSFREGYVREETGYWTPSQRDIDRLERRLATFFVEEEQTWSSVYRPPLVGNPVPLSRYARQYVGLILNGKRFIWVNAFVHRWPEDARVNFLSAGGGCAFWRVYYDLKNRSFGRLDCNGYM